MCLPTKSPWAHSYKCVWWKSFSNDHLVLLKRFVSQDIRGSQRWENSVLEGLLCPIYSIDRQTPVLRIIWVHPYLWENSFLLQRHLNFTRAAHSLYIRTKPPRNVFHIDFKFTKQKLLIMYYSHLIKLNYITLSWAITKYSLSV